MKVLIEYLPLLTLIMLFFGMMNLYSYYEEFNVVIFSFMDYADILYGLFPKMVLISSLFFSTIFSSVIEDIRRPENGITNGDDFRDNLRAFFKKHFWKVFFSFIVFNLFLSILFTNILKIKPYDLNLYYGLSDILYLFIFYMGIVSQNKTMRFLQKPLRIALFLTLFISSKISSYNKRDAYAIKDGVSTVSKHHITFKYQDRIIQTSDTVMWIGETSKYFFLYDTLRKTTDVYKYENADSITFR